MSNRLKQIVADTLGLGPQQLTADSSNETLYEWTSMAQVNLAVVLEGEYAISLSVDDITHLTSMRRIGDILGRHGVDVQLDT